MVEETDPLLHECEGVSRSVKDNTAPKPVDEGTGSPSVRTDHPKTDHTPSSLPHGKDVRGRVEPSNLSDTFPFVNVFLSF